MTILVFDSGIGGLTVLREARLMLPGHRFVYVGDDAGFPYGGWEEEALTTHMVGLFDQLIERYKPRLAIVACNTASTLIMPALRSRFDIPFVGIVPAIKPAAERTASGLVSVLATPGTVARPYIKDMVEAFAGPVDVTLVGATRLAQLAETHMQQLPIDQAVLREEIAPCFVERDGKRTDIVTLGCTHYPFLVNEMRKIAPWPVDWLDPAEAVARRAAYVLGGGLESVQQGEFSSECADGALSISSSHSGDWVDGEDQYAARTDDIAIMTSGSPTRATARLLRSAGLTLYATAFESRSALLVTRFESSVGD